MGLLFQCQRKRSPFTNRKPPLDLRGLSPDSIRCRTNQSSIVSARLTAGRTIAKSLKIRWSLDGGGTVEPQTDSDIPHFGKLKANDLCT